MYCPGAPDVYTFFFVYYVIEYENILNAIEKPEINTDCLCTESGSLCKPGIIY